MARISLHHEREKRKCQWVGGRQVGKLSPPPSRTHRLLAMHHREKDTISWLSRLSRSDQPGRGITICTPAHIQILPLILLEKQRHRRIGVNPLAGICDLERPFGVFLGEPELANHHLDGLVGWVANLRCLDRRPWWAGVGVRDLNVVRVDWGILRWLNCRRRWWQWSSCS